MFLFCFNFVDCSKKLKLLDSLTIAPNRSFPGIKLKKDRGRSLKTFTAAPLQLHFVVCYFAVPLTVIINSLALLPIVTI